MGFTNEEYADMHFIFGFCDGNASAAREEYGRRYPGRRLPHRNTFEGVHRRLRETGSFRGHNQEIGGQINSNPVLEENI